MSENMISHICKENLDANCKCRICGKVFYFKITYWDNCSSPSQIGRRKEVDFQFHGNSIAYMRYHVRVRDCFV